MEILRNNMPSELTQIMDSLVVFHDQREKEWICRLLEGQYRVLSFAVRAGVDRVWIELISLSQPRGTVSMSEVPGMPDDGSKTLRSFTFDLQSRETESWQRQERIVTDLALNRATQYSLNSVRKIWSPYGSGTGAYLMVCVQNLSSFQRGVRKFSHKSDFC